MIRNKKIMRALLLGPAMGAILGAGILLGCTGDTEGREGSESSHVEVSQSISSESGGEHGSGREGGRESGGEEGSAAMLAPDETFDMVRGGARLVLSYDAGSNAFTGTVENTTNNTLTRVRIEVHLSNGTELGPTTPIDMTPGQVATVDLPSTQAAFTGWVAHAEVGNAESGGEHGSRGGSGGEGSEGSGEHGGRSEGSGESGDGGGAGSEAGEAAMSSPTIPLDQSWNGTLVGLVISARYDAATRSVESTVRNATSEVLCYVQAEPHLKSGTRTVGELGPDVLGHLSPGQEVTSSISVATEPALSGVAFDGYVVHMEVFDCAGPGPQPHAGGEGAESSGREGGVESGGEHGGRGGESGSEHGSGGEGSGSDE